jgi:hypothetical protein
MSRWVVICFACTTVALGIAIVRPLAPRILAAQSESHNNEDIVFPTKTFLSTEAYVAVKGTLAGDWLAYKNNTYSFLCLAPPWNECMVASVQQIGPSMVSSIDGPIVYPVKRWTHDEVVAEDDALCSRITISFDRKAKIVTWVEIPINQTEIACKNADKTVRAATIEASIYWRQRQRD